MEDFNLYNNLTNELISDQSKNAIIEKVFENKTKSMLQGKITDFFPDGGAVNEKKIYTPYEFLYELLPQVYGRNYIVSDSEGKEMDEKIKLKEDELKEDEKQVLINSNALSIYADNVNEIDRNRIELERRKLQSDKIFITESELQAYLIANPNLNRTDYTKKDAYPTSYYVANQFLFIEKGEKNEENDTYEKKYVYKYDYISGNVAKKIKELSQDKDIYISSNLLTEEEYESQKNILVNNRKKIIQITDNPNDCLVITPYSKFARKYRLDISDFIEGEEYFLKSDGVLQTVFSEWVTNSMDSQLLNDVPSRQSIITYFCNYLTLSSTASDYEKSQYSDIREKTFRNGKLMMIKFLNLLTDDAKRKLELEWNGKYNFYKEPQYEKFPVACSLSSVFKDGSPFLPNESQVQSMQFMKAIGSGLLAFGVGVGKTASAIMNLSYWLGSNQANRPILVVPNAVYEKWKTEMFGGESKSYEVTYLDNNFETKITFDNLKKAKKFKEETNGTILEKTRIIEGHIPQWANYVELGNLNEESVKAIKNYSEDDLTQMADAKYLVKYVKQIPNSYNFDDDVINSVLEEKYKTFFAQDFLVRYDNYVFNIKEDFAKKKKIEMYEIYEGSNYYDEFLQKIDTKYNFFTTEFKIYNQELPYILGTIKEYDNKTIFICTYEGLKHLGLSEITDIDDVDVFSEFNDIHTEISQNGTFEITRFDRKKNSLDAKYYQAVFGTKNTILSLKEFNFDCAIFDESHFIKNNYTETLGDYKNATQRASRYKIGGGKKPSILALSGYFLSRFIGLKNGDKNVMHLTATPFTNSPNEIYGMLALTNYSFLNQYGFNNLTDFYDIFMDVSYDLVFSPSGVERKEQLVGFQNLPALRNMIYATMNYKSGEDANIKRPSKYLMPNVATDERTILPETKEQDLLFKKIKDYMRSNISYEDLCGDVQTIIDIDEMTEDNLIEVILEKGSESQQEKYSAIERPIDDEDEFFKLKEIVDKILQKTVEVTEESLAKSEIDGYRVMRGLNVLKNVTLSPYLSKCAKEGNIEPTAQQYVESSPKILYSVNSIKSIHDWERRNEKQLSGCVIYMNIGINVKNKNFSWRETGLEKIEKYLVNNLGYAYDDISIVSGKVKNVDREKQKNRFLNGNSIIMLGSSAISTGIDLQDNASTLFLCDFDWNPTTNEQIAGRIHRQGNRFANVRIVYPMIRNSFDPSVFQTLYEKTLRIKNLWDKNDTGSVLNVKEFDLNELRKNILDEPEDLARFEIGEKVIKLESDINLRKNRILELSDVKEYVDTINENENRVRGSIVVFNAFDQFLKWEKKGVDLENKLKELRDEQINQTDEKEKIKIGKQISKKLEENEEYKISPKFVELSYEDLGNEQELLSNLNYYILNSNSVSNRFGDMNRNRIRRGWLAENFPRFYGGYFNIAIPEADDVYRTIDFDSIEERGNVDEMAYKFRNAVRRYNKMKDLMQILGITLDNIDDTIETLKTQVAEYEQEQKNVEDSFDTIYEEYFIKKAERQISQMTLQEKVDEFSELNYLLEEQLRPIQMDEARVVVSPVQILDIRPNVEQAEIVETEIKKKQDKPISAKPKKPRIIGRLKKGLIVLFKFSNTEEEFTTNYETTLFYENKTEEYILFKLTKNEENEQESEEILSEVEVINYYESMNEYIVAEEYDKDESDGEEIEIPFLGDVLDITLLDGFYVKINPNYTATVRNLNSFKSYLQREDEIFGGEFGEITYIDNTASKEWVNSLNQIINDKKAEIEQQTMTVETNSSNDFSIEFIQEQIDGLIIVKEITDDLETLQLIEEQINGLNIIIDLKNQEND